MHTATRKRLAIKILRERLKQAGLAPEVNSIMALAYGKDGTVLSVHIHIAQADIEAERQKEHEA